MADKSGTSQGVVLDVLTQLKDAGLIAATVAPSQVDATDVVLDLGTGILQGELHVDVSEIEVASTDEGYTIVLEGSNDEDFSGTSRIAPLAVMKLGAAATIGTNAEDTGLGKFIRYFRNYWNEETYRYIRLNTIVEGTVASGINFTAALLMRRM